MANHFLFLIYFFILKGSIKSTKVRTFSPLTNKNPSQSLPNDRQHSNNGVDLPHMHLWQREPRISLCNVSNRTYINTIKDRTCRHEQTKQWRRWQLIRHCDFSPPRSCATQETTFHHPIHHPMGEDIRNTKWMGADQRPHRKPMRHPMRHTMCHPMLNRMRKSQCWIGRRWWDWFGIMPCFTWYW